MIDESYLSKLQTIATAGGLTDHAVVVGIAPDGTPFATCLVYDRVKGDTLTVTAADGTAALDALVAAIEGSLTAKATAAATAKSAAEASVLAVAAAKK